MARRGRKRKTGNRERNGQLQRERGIDQNAAAAQLPHRTADVYWLNLRRAIPPEKRHDPKVECPLGRYNVAEFISDEQYEAGVKFRRTWHAVRRVLDIRKERESVAGFGQPSAPTPRDLSDKEAVEIMANYMDAFNSIALHLTATMGHEAQSAIKHVVIWERELFEPTAFTCFSMGLNNLASYYKRA